jgi:hypothetical protein
MSSKFLELSALWAAANFEKNQHLFKIILLLLKWQRYYGVHKEVPMYTIVPGPLQTLIILFSEMLKFSKNIFFRGSNGIFEYILFVEMEISKLINYSTNMSPNHQGELYSTYLYMYVCTMYVCMCVLVLDEHAKVKSCECRCTLKSKRYFSRDRTIFFPRSTQQQT